MWEDASRCHKIKYQKGGGTWVKQETVGWLTPGSAQGKAMALSSSFLLDFLGCTEKDQHRDRREVGVPCVIAPFTEAGLQALWSSGIPSQALM